MLVFGDNIYIMNNFGEKVKGKKYITFANIITVIRVLLAPVLFNVKPFGVAFFIIYAVCGISDLLDGIIARKTHTESKFGSILDSFADFVVLCIVVTILSINIVIADFIIYWIISIVCIKAVSLIVGGIKYKKAAFLHTLANKFAGIVIFLAVFLIAIVNVEVVLIILCVITSVAAIEELAIQVISKELDLNIKSVFALKKVQI